MRSAVSTLELATPRDLAEALALLAAAPRTPLAGCTDLYVALNAGTLAATRFLDLSAVAELRGIRVADGRLVIGALATHAEIERSPLVAVPTAKCVIVFEPDAHSGNVMAAELVDVPLAVVHDAPARDTATRA